MPVGAQRSCGRSPLSLQLSPPPRVLASFGNVCEKHTEGAGLERWREAPCGERGGCCEEGSQRRRAVEESRAFARGLQPGVKLGNCALMTWRSPLGFPETHFCLLSPESPRSVPRGPVGTAGGESVPLGNKTDPRRPHYPAFPAPRRTTMLPQNPPPRHPRQTRHCPHPVS